MALTRSAIRSPTDSHHGGGDAGLHAEAVRQVGGAIELAAGNVDQALGGFAEGDDAGIQAMDEGAERNEIQGAVGRIFRP